MNFQILYFVLYNLVTPHYLGLKRATGRAMDPRHAACDTTSEFCIVRQMPLPAMMSTTLLSLLSRPLPRRLSK
jgi:hypothetical protein